MSRSRRVSGRVQSGIRRVRRREGRSAGAWAGDEQDTVLMAAVDKVHASVMLIHILKRHPTGDAAIEEIASLVGLIPVPIGRGTIAWGLSEELVVPELHFGTYQRGAKRPHPRAKLGLCNVGPNPVGLLCTILNARSSPACPFSHAQSKASLCFFCSIGSQRSRTSTSTSGGIAFSTTSHPPMLAKESDLKIARFWVDHSFWRILATIIAGTGWTACFDERIAATRHA